MNNQSDILIMAAEMLDIFDQQDRSQRSLSELLRIDASGSPTKSGLTDNDYQTLSSFSPSFKDLHQMRLTKEVHLPAEIIDHLQKAKCHCTMGLLPEIDRAWLSVDSEIYIWSYKNQHDIAYYDNLNHVILGVGLITPKAKVFIAEVKYLLILTTPNEIVVLGVTFEGTESRSATSEDLHLLSSPIFVIGTDNVPLLIIKGSEDGRIFLGGRDGCLYELFYQPEATWFGKRCRKINHSQGVVSSLVPNFFKMFTDVDPVVSISIDNSRKLLYVLTENGCIESWYIGTDYLTMRRIGQISQNQIVKMASDLIRTVDESVFSPVKAVCPLDVEESIDMQFIAVTQCGVRLYFTLFSKDSIQRNSHRDSEQQCDVIISYGKESVFNSDRYTGINLLHVRLPPGYTPNTTFTRPRNVHNAIIVDGNTLLLTKAQQNCDALWAINSKSILNSVSLVESTTIEQLDGNIWSIAGATLDSCNSTQSYIQKVCSKNEVVLLTNQGVKVMKFGKSLDILRQLLLQVQCGQHDSVKTFFDLHTAQEACIACFLLTLPHENLDSELVIWATQAFVLYGEEPNIHTYPIVDKAQHQVTRFPSNRILSPTHYQWGTSNPETTRDSSNQAGGERGYYGGTQAADRDSKFSAKHDSLYILVARSMRSFWNTYCVNNDLCSLVTVEQCKSIITDLRNIKLFLQENSCQDISKRIQSSSPQGTQRDISRNTSYPQDYFMGWKNLEEQRSIYALYTLLSHFGEVLSLWCILNEHDFKNLVHHISMEHQNILKGCTFKDLATLRTDICGILIVALIDSYLKDDTSISALSAGLRDVCPSLYRHEDSVTFKATEILIKSKLCSSENERNNMLKVALELCKTAASSLPLHRVCQEFLSVGYYEGVVDLAVSCAFESDPDQLGIHYYINGEPADDPEGYRCYLARVTSYNEICLALDHKYNVMKNSDEEKQISENSYRHSVPTHLNNGILDNIKQLIKTKDPLLHASLYDWLLNHGLLTELLEIRDPSLGDFLRRQVDRHPENITYSDLLWKYYEKNGDHIRAAQILDRLSSIKNNSISLKLRIEHIIKAVMCMRNENTGSSISSGVFLKELEDKLEIARIQNVILNELCSTTRNNIDVNQAVCELNSALYDLSELFEKYACRYSLWECQLLILNCSHHNDPHLVETIWINIIKNIICESSSHETYTKLFSTISKLYREFGESTHCFPLEFVIHELEINACRLNFPEGVVAKELLKMGVNIEMVLDFYSRSISMNERIWSKDGSDLHLVKSAKPAIYHVLNDANDSIFKSKRRIIGKAEDLIAICLSLCYQKSNADELQKELEQLQLRFKRVTMS